MKKVLSFVLFLVLTIAAATVAFADPVQINEANFPDESFRNAVRECDRNGDGKLSEAEISDVREFFVANTSISSLKGIDYFTAL